MLRLFLEKENYQVTAFHKAEDVFYNIKNIDPDLILLDILLPGIDGVELCYRLRRYIDGPILFISCKTVEIDKVVGLSAGGDDYI